MSLIDKTKQVSGQAVGKVGETVGDPGGDDLIVNTVIFATGRVRPCLDRSDSYPVSRGGVAGALYHCSFGTSLGAAGSAT